MSSLFKEKYVVGVIPARMGSSRFYGKPLAKILGHPMIYHVYQRSVLARSLSDLYIATPDTLIQRYCKRHQMNVMMTKSSHFSASDRAAEAMLKIEKLKRKKVDVLVLIQGDEPLIVPQMIDLAVGALLKEKDALVVNLVGPIQSQSEFKDPNTIKVVVNKFNHALFLTREAIPSLKKTSVHKAPHLKQICVIPYQRDFLLKFNRLKQTPLEQAEGIDMLRCLENGFNVKMVFSPFTTYSVDTPADLKKVNHIIKNDKLIKCYV